MTEGTGVTVDDTERVIVNEPDYFSDLVVLLASMSSQQDREIIGILFIRIRVINILTIYFFSQLSVLATNYGFGFRGTF